MADEKDYRKREVLFLISFLLLFGIVFLLSVINFNRNTPIFGLGINIEVENWLVMILSVIAIFKVFGMILRS
ncbi:MAG: hypothetical protein ACOC1K_04485 [Nanoarchaeota archaeon]